MLRRSPALIACILCVIVGGLMLGAGDPATPNIATTTQINWEAIAAMSTIAFGFIAGNWFIVSMAVMSAVRQSEAMMRAERAKALEGYIPREMCHTMHADTERRIEYLEAHGRQDREQSHAGNVKTGHRIDDLEARA